MTSGPAAFCVIGLSVGLTVVVGRAQQDTAQDVDVGCSASATIVVPPQTVRVKAWVEPVARRRLTFQWAATAGQLRGTGTEADWTVAADTRPPYRATVRANGPDKSTGTCTIEVWPPPGGRGPTEREAGKTLLVDGAQAPPGYGLYSYLLLGAEPIGPTRKRYLSTLEAWWALAPDLIRLEKYLEPTQLHAMFVPVTEAIATVTPDDLLRKYDYVRARMLMRAIGETGRDGPYFVSSLQPLSLASGPGGDYLFQDLSAVPSELAAAWTKEFLNQAAQQRFWVERTWPMMGLRIRTMVSVLATDLEEVRRSVGQLIRWRGDVPNRQ